MVLISSKDQSILKDLSDLKGAIETLQTIVGTLLGNVDGGLNTSFKGEFGLIEEMIDDLAHSVADPYYVGLKDRRNMPAINRLPVEVFTYIILLANMNGEAHPYLSYTWVCRHWRSTLIRSPVFWTLIQSRLVRKRPIQKTFYYELFQRSKSFQVDVILSSFAAPFNTMLKDLFSKQSSRIRRLRLDNNHEKSMKLVLSGKNLPSLRGFALIDDPGFFPVLEDPRSLQRLLPILTASIHLDTFQCSLYGSDLTDTSKDQMASIFRRIRNLSLTLCSVNVIGPVLDLLHNNASLRSLQLTFKGLYSRGQFTFPELQFLSIDNFYQTDHIQIPKLSSLNVQLSPNHPILKQFDFSVKYLWIRERCSRDRSEESSSSCILGTKERTDCGTMFSENTDILFGDHPVRECPRDCFHLGSLGGLTSTLKEALSSIIPRLTNLIELHLLFPQTYSVCRETIPRVPSIQKLVVRSGDGLIGLLRLLSNPSQCPRLTHLSYATLPLPDDLKEYADDIGKNLTNCLQSRQKDSPSDMLKYIELGNCPPLPESWLEELHKLGAQVVTEKDIESATEIQIRTKDTNPYRVKI